MCTSPRTASHNPNGGRINYSKRKYDKQFSTFQVPCGKCIECRLEYAREWAVRGSHEATMHRSSIFLTLTFTDDQLGANRLDYHEFQLFMERLYYVTQIRYPFMVSGEYGDNTGRKHYHAIIFGIDPQDSIAIRKTKDGHLIYRSPLIEKAWGHGMTEYGSVTFESISYIARYCLKKRGDKETDPLFKTSRQSAIGKSWLEKNYQDIFKDGILVTRDGFKTKIPRYYEKWFKTHHLEQWKYYVTEIKNKKTTQSQRKKENEILQHTIETSARQRNGWNYKNQDQRRAYLQKLKQSEIKRKLD